MTCWLTGDFRGGCFFLKTCVSRFPVCLLPFGTAKVAGLFGWARGGVRNRLWEGCKWLIMEEKKSLERWLNFTFVVTICYLQLL